MWGLPLSLGMARHQVDRGHLALQSEENVGVASWEEGREQGNSSQCQPPSCTSVVWLDVTSGQAVRGLTGDPWREGLVSWPQPDLAPGSPGLACSHPVFSKQP